MAKGLDEMLLDLLGDPAAAARQADLMQAAALARQERALRQRAGAAAARLRRARAEDADPEEIADLEATLAARGARLTAAQGQAATADVVRPEPDDDRAQVFARATGPVEAPPLTLAALQGGKPVAQATANARGIAHLVADGPLKDVTLQASDAKGRVLWRAREPVSVAAGETFALDIDLEAPKPAPGPVPKAPKMPDLVGQGDGVARKLLERLGVGSVSVEENSAEGQPGIVLAQTPEPGTELGDDTAVTLTVRRGKDGAEARHVPGLIGAAQKDAERRLDALGLKMEVKSEPRDGPAGLVLAQDPEEGQPIEPGATVVVVVSEDTGDTPETVTVPDLAGRSRDMAEAMLEAAGLAVAVQEVSEADTKAGVVAQTPAGGTVVARGTGVTILVNTPPAAPAARTIVPGLVGRSLTEAQRALKALNLSAEITRTTGAAPKDQVLAQEPEPGTRLEPGGSVLLSVSDGRAQDGDRTEGLARLARSMARDPRAEELGLTEARIVAVLNEGGAKDLDAARGVAALETAELRDQLRLGRIKDATTFRAILRKSLKELE